MALLFRSQRDLLATKLYMPYMKGTVKKQITKRAINTIVAHMTISVFVFLCL